MLSPWWEGTIASCCTVAIPANVYLNLADQFYIALWNPRNLGDWIKRSNMSEKKKMKSEASSSSSNSITAGNDSVVVEVGRRRNSCGYCKSGGPTSISHGNPISNSIALSLKALSQLPHVFCLP